MNLTPQKFADWLTYLIAGQPLIWPEAPLPGSGRALAVAPHPDDPEAIAVTLRLLVRGGWQMSWVVLTRAWSGVQDDFVGPDPEAKTQVRQAEQREAAKRFGLQEQRLSFLCLAEDARGDLAETDANRQNLFSVLDNHGPDLVLLPAPEDTNRTHRLTYRWFAEWARAAPRPVVALGNEDPKTTNFRPDFQVQFGAETAAWKAGLLECHRSQSSRNLATRCITFAERILQVNRACPGLQSGMHAERFQVASWQT